MGVIASAEAVKLAQEVERQNKAVESIVEKLECIQKACEITASKVTYAEFRESLAFEAKWWSPTEVESVKRAAWAWRNNVMRQQSKEFKHKTQVLAADEPNWGDDEVESFFRQYEQFTKLRKTEAAKFELLKSQAASSSDRPVEEGVPKKKSVPSGSSSTMFEMLDSEQPKNDNGEEC